VFFVGSGWGRLINFLFPPPPPPPPPLLGGQNLRCRGFYRAYTSPVPVLRIYVRGHGCRPALQPPNIGAQDFGDHVFIGDYYKITFYIRNVR